ncbi:MAG: cytochrome P450, partial [Bacteroidota bacterium]
MTTQTKSPPYTPHRKHWLFGDGKEISKGVLDWLKEAEAGAGDIFKAKLPIGKMIATTKPEYIKHVLVDNAKNYHKSVAYQVMKHFLGEGLLTSEGDFWLRQRRLAQPAFHKKKLAAIAHSMSDEARKHMERWKALEKKGGGFDMLSEMMEVTMRIVARALFSAEMEENIGEIGSRIGELNEFAVERTTSLVKLPLWVPTKMARGFKTAAKAVDSVIYRIIEERRAADAQYDDLLSMLMEAKDEDTGEMMNAKQLRDEAVTIFVAGHETT